MKSFVTFRSCLVLFAIGLTTEASLCRLTVRGHTKILNLEDCNLPAVPRANDKTASADDLIYKNNYITSLPNSTFTEFTAATKIDLSDNRISLIDKSAFRGMRYVRQLGLARNKLKNVPWQIFAHLERLEILTLSGNPIEYLHEKDFVFLTKLQTLSLNDCNLLGIEAGALHPLGLLNELHLKNNLLEEIPLRDLKIESLRKLELAGNRISCDCSQFAKDLRSFLKELLKKPFYGQNKHSMFKCVQPRHVAGEWITDLDPSEMLCAPVIVNASDANLTVGNNTLNLTEHTLSARVCMQPRTLTWYHNNITISVLSLTDENCTETSVVAERLGEYVLKAQNPAGLIETRFYYADDRPPAVALYDSHDEDVYQTQLESRDSDTLSTEVIIAAIVCGSVVALTITVVVPILVFRYRRFDKVVKQNSATKSRLSRTELQSMMADPTLSPSATLKGRVLSAKRPESAPMLDHNTMDMSADVSHDVSNDDCDSGRHGSSSADDLDYPYYPAPSYPSYPAHNGSTGYPSSTYPSFNNRVSYTPNYDDRIDVPRPQFSRPPPKPARSFASTLPRDGSLSERWTPASTPAQTPHTPQTPGLYTSQPVPYLSTPTGKAVGPPESREDVECDVEHEHRTSSDLAKQPFSSFKPAPMDKL